MPKSLPAMLQHFAYSHLPEEKQAVSKQFCELAEVMVDMLPNNRQTEQMLTKLLEAKDCAVRALSSEL